MSESTKLFFEASIEPIESTAELTGKAWEVVIIGKKEEGDLVTIDGKEYIKSKNDRLYSVDALVESVPMWDSAKVYDNHLTPEEFEKKLGMRSPAKEWLGTIVEPYWASAKHQLKGVFKVVDDRLAGKLKNAWEQGVLETIGLSIDSFPMVHREVRHEGQMMPIIEGFKKILSVDLVGDPAAGGGFERILAANINKEHTTMDKELEEKIQAMIANGFSELQAGIPGMVQSTIAEALAADEVEETEQAQEADTDEDNEEDEPAAEAEPVDDTAQQALQEARTLRFELLLNKKLTEAKLDDNHRAIVEAAFNGRIAEAKEIEDMIKKAKTAQAAGDPTGRVTESGGGRTQVTFDEKDKAIIAFMQKVLGTRDFQRAVESEDSLVTERVSESAAIKAWKKNGSDDVRFGGRMSELLRVNFLNGGWSLEDVSYQEALTLATVIKNTVNVMTALDYAGSNRWYEQIVDVEESDNPIDDMTLARLFGADSLDVVSKGAAYTEMQLNDEEETASHVKQGNYVAIALEDLMADKIGYFRDIGTRLSDAWYNTLSAKVAAVFTVNSAAGPVLSDTGALFNATAVTTAGGHANLLTTALSYSQYDTVITAMYNQTARLLGGGRKLVDMGPFNLLVPVNLRSTANDINNSELKPGTGNNDRNQYQGQVNPVIVPDWTDTNNFAVMARYRGRSPIKLFFPPGMRTPQIVTADSELAGAMFTNDTIRYKLRMMTYRFSSTYDCAPVADWRLLHKSNVA